MTPYSVPGLFLGLVLCASVAKAQPPEQSPVTPIAERGPGEPRIPINARIFLLDNQGAEHRGRFLRFDDREIVVLIDKDERRFDRNVITRIERPDSLNNGAGIGAIVGLTIGLLQAFTVARGDAGLQTASVLVQTGIYTAAGICFDSLVQGRTVVYQADPASPVRKPGGAALAFSIQW